MVFFHSLVSFFFLCPFFLSLSTAERECLEDQLDSCSRRLFLYGDKDHAFGQTREELSTNCRRSREAEICVRDFVKRCYKNPLIRQYFQILMKGPSNVLKKSCTKAGIREILRHKECLQISKPALDDCAIQAIRDTVQVSKADQSAWLPASCW